MARQQRIIPADAREYIDYRETDNRPTIAVDQDEDTCWYVASTNMTLSGR